MDLGFNTFRVPFLLERMTPPATGIAGAFDETYLGDLKSVSLSCPLIQSLYPFGLVLIFRVK